MSIARGTRPSSLSRNKLGTARYIRCRNVAKAEPERNERRAIVAGLSKQLARGDKALIGNSAAYRTLPAPDTKWHWQVRFGL